jgi:hypothetical protein
MAYTSKIRHFGVFIQDMKWVSSVLEKLGFFVIYDNNELLFNQVRQIKKYKLDNLIIELIQGFNYQNNHYHISLTMEVPDFMKNDKSYIIQKYNNPNNPSLEVTFVYINDSLYFEFVKEKI